MTKIEIIFNGERLYGLSEVLAYLDKQRECISELERENAELKQLIEWLDMAIDSDIPIADKLAELEKENARLKEEIKNNEDLATVAYMQGAERYKPKWHKVDDGDLPKHEVNVLVLHSVQCVDIAHYNYDYKEWHFADSIVRDVIAWCEIPRYAEGGIK